MKRVIFVVLLAILLSACGGKQAGTPPEPVPHPSVSEKTTDPHNEIVTETENENNTPPEEPSLEKLRLQTLKKSAQDILSGVAYYGNPAKCEMTAEQAIAYAQLMANGIAGVEFYDEWTEEISIRFWDRGFSVLGYGGPYKANRASVILGDFAGDGNPYLYLFDGEKDGCFTIYGWQNDTIKLLFDFDTWMGRSYAHLTDQDIVQGLAQLSYSGTGGAADHLSEQYSFVNGASDCVSSYHEYYDYESDCWHIVENGVDQTFSAEEYETLDARGPTPRPIKTSPELQAYTGPSLDEVCNAPNTLREMITALNHYVQTLSEGTLDTVTIREPSDTTVMATEMLGALDEYYEITDAALFDMDDNGKQELLVVHFDQNIPRCDVYTWNNSTLSKTDYGHGMVDDIGIVQNQQTGEHGIFTGSYTDETNESFYYPSGKISLLYLGFEGEQDPFYCSYENDDYENKTELMEESYLAQRDEHKSVHTFNTNPWDGTGKLDAVKATLRSMQ